MGNDSNINTKDFLIGTLIGGVVGAVSALLLAPKSGKEIREDLGEQSEMIKRKSNEIAQYAKEKSSNIAQTVSNQSNQVVNKVKDWQQDTLKKEPSDGLVDDSAEDTSEEHEQVEVAESEEEND